VNVLLRPVITSVASRCSEDFEARQGNAGSFVDEFGATSATTVEPPAGTVEEPPDSVTPPDETSDDTQTAVTEPATTEPTPTEPGDTVEVFTDAEQFEWEGVLTYFDDTVPFEFVDSYVLITREQGTDQFEVTAFLEYRTLPANCSFDWFKTYEGTGTIAGDQIVFDGPDTVTTTSTCPEANLKDDVSQRRVTVNVSEFGLEGFLSGGEFVIEGTPPTPISGD
jgi:hypothetical protein